MNAKKQLTIGIAAACGFLLLLWTTLSLTGHSDPDLIGVIKQALGALGASLLALLSSWMTLINPAAPQSTEPTK